MTDPTSPDFDPLLALYGEDSTVDPDVKPFNNLAQFEAHLKRTNSPGEPEKKHRSSSKKAKSFSQRRRIAEEVQNRDVSKLQQMMLDRKRMDAGEDIDTTEKPQEPQTSKPNKTNKNVFSSMQDSSEGPMSLLYKAVHERLRCCVYVRDFCGLRGVCRGYIAAYDRYMNLAMIDVDETFRKPPLGQVKDHQKQLSVQYLEEAFKQISIEGIGEGKNVIKKKIVDSKDKRPVPCQAANLEQRDEKIDIKLVGKDFFKTEKFAGGYPLLYHRHIPQFLVKGDNVVLISLHNS